MSCTGDNFVVPGANPCNQPTATGVQSITPGTNITITGTPTIPIISATDTLTQAFGNNTASVSVLTTVSTSLSAVGFTTSGASDVFCSATITIQTNSNVQYNNSFSLAIDGVVMSSGVFIDSINGIGHYKTVTITGFRANLVAGNHTLRLLGLSSAPNGTMTITRITTSGLANLL